MKFFYSGSISRFTAMPHTLNPPHCHWNTERATDRPRHRPFMAHHKAR